MDDDDCGSYDVLRRGGGGGAWFCDIESRGGDNVPLPPLTGAPLMMLLLLLLPLLPLPLPQ